jgi:carbonic anhydrase
MKLKFYVMTIVIINLFKNADSLGKLDTVYGYMNTFAGPDSLAKSNDIATNNIPSPMNANGEIHQIQKIDSNLVATENVIKPVVVNLNDPNAELSDWLSISYYKSKENITFPGLGKSNVNVNIFQGFELSINSQFQVAHYEGAKFNGEFWFRARSGYIYYSATKEDINIIHPILVNSIQNIAEPVATSIGIFHCFSVFDYQNIEYKICALDSATKLKWLCSLELYTGINIDPICKAEDQNNTDVNYMNSTLLQNKPKSENVIIIPKQARKCNDNWDYKNKGKDWECGCADGKFQSPIDLPLKEETTNYERKPVFMYDVIPPIADFDINGFINKGENIKILNDKGVLKIKHPNMGTISLDDGTIYQAEEIIFHTPSEHTINGERYDMEMQVIHIGVTPGDINKQAILSFLFTKKPNVFNKFIDNLDFLNLPNEAERYKDLAKELYIPNVLLNADETETDTKHMRKFSFYTYYGSITSPPCTERTMHFVHADPIPLSNTAIDLFSEAIRKLDSDKFLTNSCNSGNSRVIQPRNNREVLIYDHIKSGCPDFKKEEDKVEVALPIGHYEKMEKSVSDFIYVDGPKPSGLPDSFVVPKGDVPEEYVLPENYEEELNQ